MDCYGRLWLVARVLAYARSLRAPQAGSGRGALPIGLHSRPHLAVSVSTSLKLLTSRPQDLPRDCRELAVRRRRRARIRERVDDLEDTPRSERSRASRRHCSRERGGLRVVVRDRH